MSLLTFLNVVVVSVVIYRFSNLDPFLLGASSLLFFLFGFFLHGEIELEIGASRSRNQLWLWRIFDNTLPTFLPAILAVYLVLVPGTFLLVPSLGIGVDAAQWRGTLTVLLATASIVLYVVLSRVFPAAIEISQDHPISILTTKTLRWTLFVVGFVVFDRILKLAISEFNLSGLSLFFFLIAIGVVPYRVFGAIYAPIPVWSKAVGVVLAAIYLFQMSGFATF